MFSCCSCCLLVLVIAMAVPPVDAFTSVLQVLLTAALKDAIVLVECCPNLCRLDPDCNDLYSHLFMYRLTPCPSIAQHIGQ